MPCDEDTVIVAGATGNDNSGGTNAGHTRVFEWRNESWIQKGSDIDGNQGNGQMGYQTRISADGNSVAVSSSLISTDVPNLSSSLSALIVIPFCIQALPFHS